MRGLPCPPEHWDAFSRLLDSAFDLPASERDEWLEALPEEHVHLRPWLARVLTADARARTGDYLTKLQLPGDPDNQQTFATGQAVGPYRLDTLLGSGGMGEVWRARRIDGVLDRIVALKLPRAEYITSGMRERLRRERDILASLTHPRIAQLYDAGITPQGQPFLALELVDGHPIDQHCRENRLGVDARVALFVQVLDAVRFAHSRLVVHRDLKPSNIFVTNEGQVKLLDFGIAKLLDEQGSGDATALTHLAGHAMTPEYAAPEQIAREPVSVATDVFALGVILFELLTGQRPFGRARSDEAPLASTRIVPEHAPTCGDADVRGLRRALAGDLDAILACCLMPAPAQRYPSVEQLAEDLRRHLHHEPIRARRITRRERAGKFVRRNRVPVAMSAALTLALVVGVAGIAWQARRADAAAAESARNAQAAEQRARELKTVVDFQAGQLARMDVEQFGTQFLDQMRARIESAAGDPATRRALIEGFDRMRPLAQPADVARRTLGQYLLAPAQSQIDEEFAQQPRTRALLIGGLARSYSDLGLFEDAIAETRRFDEAARGVFDEDSTETARIRILEAGVLVNVGRAREGVAVARKAAEGLERTLGPRHLDTLLARRTLAMALTFSEDRLLIEEAVATFSSIEGDLRAVLGEKDGQYLEARRLHAYALRLLERPREAADILVGVADTERQEPERYRKQLPKVLVNLCEVQSLAGGADAALAICGEAVARARQLLGEEHLTTLTALIFAFRVQEAAGDLAGSFATLESAYETSQRFASPQWQNTQFVALSYAGALVDRGRAKEAPPILRRLMEQAADATRAAENRTLAETLIARSLEQTASLHEAIARQRAVVERARQEPGTTRYAPTFAGTILGDMLVEAGDKAEATRIYAEALANAREVPGQAEDLTVSIRTRMAFLAAPEHPDAAAIESLRRMDAELRAHAGEHSLEALQSGIRLADALRRAGLRQDACATATPLAARLQEGLGDAAPETKKALRMVRACA